MPLSKLILTGAGAGAGAVLFLKGRSRSSSGYFSSSNIASPFNLFRVWSQATCTSMWSLKNMTHKNPKIFYLSIDSNQLTEFLWLQIEVLIPQPNRVLGNSSVGLMASNSEADLLSRVRVLFPVSGSDPTLSPFFGCTPFPLPLRDSVTLLTPSTSKSTFTTVVPATSIVSDKLTPQW